MRGYRRPARRRGHLLDDNRRRRDPGLLCDQAARPRPRRDQVDARHSDPPTPRAGFGAPSTHHRRCRRMGISRLSLETGSFAFSEPARRLYLKHGFEFCGPFDDYEADPNSVFMTRILLG